MGWGAAGRGLRVLALCVCATGSGAEGVSASGWWAADGRPDAQAHEAVALLADAAADGLDPRDYDTASLQQGLAALAAGPPAAPATQGPWDTALTAAMQRYLVHLHGGRIDPHQVHAHFNLPRADAFDAAATLRDALAARRLGEAVREAAPPLPLYGQLRQALVQYRALGDHPAWRDALPPMPGRKLEPLQPYAGLTLLARRLRALNDLVGDEAGVAAGAASVPAPAAARYEGALVDAVRAFQRRHGLADDGVIGRATVAALDVPPAQRARQIALTLERLRWTPLLQSPRMIVVNLPEFVLRAYETGGRRVSVPLHMKVIVGRALDQRTPLMMEEMRFIEFSPYWNVPPSIARTELVPRLRRDPAHFDDQGFEFVTPGGGLITRLDGARLDAVLRGELRIRQRPGPANALGEIKFVFPNNANIYLHDTPTRQLFERDRRDLSHGCIRVQEPLALAKFVLQDQPEWTEERLVEAMRKGESRTLRLEPPVQVLIAYGTALVKNGRPHFFADLYGHDRVLDDALRQRAAR